MNKKIKKDIYIIRNTINNKVYVGQSVNTAHRWEQYLSACKHNSKQLIVKAMRKYGVQNFYYEILEHQVENFDEREIYWIELLNCRIPNGYNIAEGGKGTGVGINSPAAKFTNNNIVKEIKDMIKNTSKSFNTIAKKYKCSNTIISDINNGKSYYDKNEKYPLRISRKSQELIKQVIYALQYEYDKSMRQISNEYSIDLSVVNEINQGVSHRIDGKKYPLRSGRVFSINQKYADQVIELLQNSDIEQKEIAKQFNVSVSWVSSINKGAAYRKDDIVYPIRINYQNSGSRKTLEPNEIKEIENLLKNSNIGIRKIAAQYGVCYQMIAQINLGAVIKYKQENSIYPLRKI